jgi:hypothetical protein
MDPMHVVMNLSDVAPDEARSALPNAPVVPHIVAAAPLARSREVLAAVLHRAAEVVAPAPAGCAAVR